MRLKQLVRSVIVQRRPSPGHARGRGGETADRLPPTTAARYVIVSGSDGWRASGGRCARPEFLKMFAGWASASVAI